MTPEYNLTWRKVQGHFQRIFPTGLNGIESVRPRRKGDA
jgi:hypothetical protein